MAKRSYFNSLRGKLTNRALFISLLPILVLGGLTYYGLSSLTKQVDDGINQSRSILLDEVVGASLSGTATRIVQQLDGFMLERIQDAVTWASAPNVVAAARQAAVEHADRGLTGLSIDDVEAQFVDQKSLNLAPITDRYLGTQIASSLHFGEVFMTDENGFNVALTNPTSDFVQSDENWWITAMDNGISVGQVEYDASAEIWSIDISVRIDDDQSREKLGVMKAVLGVSLLQEVSDNRAAEIPGGSVSVVNHAGLLLAETSTAHSADRIMSESASLANSSSGAIQTALASTGSGYVIGDRTVLGFAKSAGAELYGSIVEGFEGFNWEVLVQQPTDVALAPINNLDTVQSELEKSGKTTLLIIALSTLVIGIIAIVMAQMLARSITTPLLQLQTAAERVAKGDTSAVVSVNSNDEIEDLAKIFERMRNSVAILITRYKKVQADRAA